RTRRCPARRGEPGPAQRKVRVAMIQQVDPKWVSAAKRAVRTFVIAFLAIDPASNLIGTVSGSQPLDTSALRAAAAAGFAAVIALVWRAFIDPLPVPTLSDTQAPPPASSPTTE